MLYLLFQSTQSSELGAVQSFLYSLNPKWLKIPRQGLISTARWRYFCLGLGTETPKAGHGLSTSGSCDSTNTMRAHGHPQCHPLLPMGPRAQMSKWELPGIQFTSRSPEDVEQKQNKNLLNSSSSFASPPHVLCKSSMSNDRIIIIKSPVIILQNRSLGKKSRSEILAWAARCHLSHTQRHYNQQTGQLII